MDMMHHHSHVYGVYEFHVYWEELLVKFICDLFGYVVSVWFYRIGGFRNYWIGPN